MFSRSKVAVVLGLSLCLTAPVLAVDLAKEVAKRGVVHWVDSKLGTRVEDMSIASIRSRIAEVSDKPCSLAIARNVTKNTQTGILGILTGAVGFRSAVEMDVGSENMKSEGFLTKPAEDNEWKKWSDYLQNANSTQGGEDLTTALVLRRKARILKFRFSLEKHFEKDFSRITDADFTGLKEIAHKFRPFKHDFNDIFEPVTIILKPQLAQILFYNVVKVGPAFGTHPTVNLISPAEVKGSFKTINGYITDDEGRFIVRRTDSVILLSDIDDLLSIDKSIDRDSLGSIVGHEMFHGIMSDVMTSNTPGTRRRDSSSSHDAHLVSTNGLAFSEGWAEFFEAWSGEDNDAFNNKDGKSKVIKLFFGRQIPVRQGFYTQVDFEKYRSTRKEGHIKNGSQMQATEGLVAGIIYKLMTHKDIEDPFSLAIEAMYKDHPQTLTQFVQAMIDHSPDDKVKRVIALVFLYETKFATVSEEARRLYQVMYGAKLTFVREKNNGVSDNVANELQQEFSATRDDYRDFVSSLQQDILAGDIALDANVGPEIWVDNHKVKDANFGKYFTFNLNTVSLPVLANITTKVFGSDCAVNFIETRDAIGKIESLRKFREMLSPEGKSFLRGMEFK